MGRKPLAWVFVAFLATGAVIATGTAASAKSKPKPSPTVSTSKLAKFCAAVGNISDEVDSAKGATDTSGAKALESSIKSAAKTAPTTSVKNAMNTMANFYGGLAGLSKGDATAKAIAGSANYAKAASTFTTYYVKNCSALATTTTTSDESSTSSSTTSSSTTSSTSSTTSTTSP
jgi:hypothetical protein